MPGCPDTIRWRVRAGAPWRDVPYCHGSWRAVHALFRRWPPCSRAYSREGLDGSSRVGSQPGGMARITARHGGRTRNSTTRRSSP
ncbi:transposase [Streptomyces sp. NBC_01235]|uniref:transposase n=1 Tax=Streptomyces sp. NBC_01235 TaxID=2903788 RepID=UPI002E1019CF|nr:transposase [Streptomyces sp. NBC_01235]